MKDHSGGQKDVSLDPNGGSSFKNELRNSGVSGIAHEHARNIATLG
jgi:hypothetical protein